MDTDEDRVRKRRWVVVAPDGRYVTLGLHSDPTEEEILAAEDGLRHQGLAGWLAVMEGNPYVGPPPSLLEVRPLASPRGSFADAAAAVVSGILARRRELDG
jgi:hypothetical protein